MKKACLFTLFFAANALAATLAFQLWNSSSLAAGASAIALWISGSLGALTGGYLAAQNLYRSSGARRLFPLLACGAFLLVSVSAFAVQHPYSEAGPFPTAPWPEHGITWLYLVLSTLWLGAEATRSN